MRSNRWHWGTDKVVAWVLCMGMVLAGCSSGTGKGEPQQPPSKAGQEPAAPAGPRKGGTLTIGRPVDAVSLDPNLESTGPGTWVYANIFETLVVLAPDMKFKPGLAESWSQPAPDKWRFALRKGVKFHDGTDFNATAVKFSIERMTDKINPGRSASNLSAVKSVDVIDEQTVEFTTVGPYGPMLNIMALINATPIESPAAVQKYGKDFGRNPVGTGPFKFADWKTNTTITLERFDGYWSEKALLDRIVFRVIPEESARMLALQTGEVDLVMNAAPSELATLRRDPKFTVHETSGVRVLWYGLNEKIAPLNDVRVRQALNFGTDRQSIVDNVLEGAAILPTSYVSPSVFGWKDVSAAWAYDPAKAKQLLDEAGWKAGTGGMRAKDGKPLSLTIWTPKGRYLKDAETVEAWQSQMKQIGVNIKVEVMEWGTMFTQVRSGPDHNVPIFVLAWSTATGDAEYTIGPMFGSKNVPPQGWNNFNYANPRVDELADKAQKTTDAPTRLAAYAEAQQILANDAVTVPIYNSKEIIVTAAHVKGFTIHPIDYFMWFDKVWLAK